MTPAYYRPPGRKPQSASVEELRKQALATTQETAEIPRVEQDPRKAEPIPFEAADTDKKEEYGSLVETLKTGELPVEPVKEQDPLFTEQDKQDFIRSLLGGRPYTKTIQLFGTFEVVLADSSLDWHQKVYSDLRKDPAKVDTEEKFRVWETRWFLALSLRKIVGIPGFEFPQEPENFQERWEQLARLPRPLYSAIVTASAEFQRSLNRLIERAQEKDFWPTGGRS